MILKNLMENKQLDFNQPFLSVRRFSSMETSSSKASEVERTDHPWPPLPVYKSELKSGPVRNPGNVPFQWEQAPGRPKNEKKAQTTASKRPSITPKLPPGMSSNLKQRLCSKGSTSGAATLSPTEDVFSNSDNFASDKNVVKYETLREKIERDLSSSSDDRDEAYLEAVDTLSRSESFFMNCSVTGLSGLDGSDVKPSGTFSTDQQTRDFMMGRFLPAAKAMASETPQVAYRKQSVQRGPQREPKKVVEVEKEHPLNPRATKMPYYAPNTCNEESGDEDNGFDGSEYSSAKACGLFARFCLRGSFCLLNPVPGMRARVGSSPVSSAHRVRNGNSIDSSYTTIKNLVDAANEEKSSHGNQRVGLHEEKRVLRGQSNRIEHKNDWQKLDKSSLCTHLKRSGTSDGPKKPSESLLPDGAVFPSGSEKVQNSKVHIEPHRRGRSKFRELLANESCSESNAIEKTLYVDSVHSVKYQSSNSSHSDIKGMRDFMVDDSDKSTRSSETKEILQLDSSPQYVQPSNAEGENKRLRSKSVESMDSCFLSCSGRSNYDAKVDLKASSLELDLIQDAMTLAEAKVVDESSDDSFQDFASFTSSKAYNRENFHLESKVPKGSDMEENSDGHDQGSITLTSSKATAPGKIDLESNLLMSVCDGKSSLPISSKLPLAPPLPRSPSESWLKRTLPTISTRNSTIPLRSTLAGRTYARQSTVF